MKKLIAILLAAMLLVSLTACGGAQEEEKYVVGICQLIKHDALDAATQGFMDALKEVLGDEQ